MEKKLKMPFPSDKHIGKITLCLFLGAVILLNIVVYVFATAFSWYFYTEERYEHTVSDATHALLSEIEHPVTVSFCSAETDIEAVATSRLVYETVKQYAAIHDEKVRLGKFYNVYTDFAKMQEYSEKTGATVTKDSVIIETDVECYALSMSDFYLLDGAGVILAYNGEEALASALLRAQVEREKLPSAYFTVDHGENFALPALLSQVFYAGYDIGNTELNTLRLSDEEIPENAALVVISNPLYDFEKSASSTVVTELDRLETYLRKGGKVYITLDAGASSYAELQNLRAFLAEYGLVTGDGLIEDGQNGITEARTFLVSYASSDVGSAVGDAITEYNTSRILVRDASPITVLAENGKGMTVSPLLETASVATWNGESGAFPVAAIAEGAGGEAILLSTSGYVNYNEAVNSEGYANEDFLYAGLSLLDCDTPLIGCRMLFIADTGLENLTRIESNGFFALTVAVIPVSLLIACAAVSIRRRRR